MASTPHSERSPSDHTDKDIRAALEKILEMDGPGFKLFKGGHWGMLRCGRGCCQISVDGTSRIPQIHAKDLVREARKCPRPDGDPRKTQKRPAAKAITELLPLSRRKKQQKKPPRGRK